MHARSDPMSACIRACLDCYQHCQNEALTHCLEIGGKQSTVGSNTAHASESRARKQR